MPLRLSSPMRNKSVCDMYFSHTKRCATSSNVPLHILRHFVLKVQNLSSHSMILALICICAIKTCIYALLVPYGSVATHTIDEQTIWIRHAEMRRLYSHRHVLRELNIVAIASANNPMFGYLLIDLVHHHHRVNEQGGHHSP